MAKSYKTGTIFIDYAPIITSNKSFIDWRQELFGDQVIASAILDRLLHHCRAINIKVHSYRPEREDVRSRAHPTSRR